MMKLAYMLTTPDVKSFPLAWQGDTADVMRRIAELGYMGVEVQVRDPGLVDAAALERHARDAGLTVCAFGTGQVGAEDGLWLTDPSADVRARAVERFKAFLHLAAHFSVDVSIGRFRGLLRWAPDRATGLAWFNEALDALVAEAERVGVRVVLEPQMRFNTDFLNTVDETIALIRARGSSALVFEGDLYHMALEEKSVPAALARGVLSGLMTYVQLGDSNRLAPGWGHLPWVDIVETLKAVGYDGWLAMEFTQQPDSPACAAQAYRFVSGLL